MREGVCLSIGWSVLLTSLFVIFDDVFYCFHVDCINTVIMVASGCCDVTMELVLLYI